VSAIKSLNDALSGPCQSKDDSDARFAAIMALTFQSSYMPDAMMDFLSMLRGWMIISETVVQSPDDSLFKSFTRESYIDSMKSLVDNFVDVVDDDDMMDDFSASLKVAAPLCQSIIEINYLSTLQRIAKLAKIAPLEGTLRQSAFI
jgi:hypothetical protein